MPPSTEVAKLDTKSQRPLYRRWWIFFPGLCLLLVALILVGAVAIVFLSHGQRGPVPIDRLSHTPVSAERDAITVLTINMAHGRGDGLHQVFLKNATIKANVDAIGDLIKREQAHVVALQEADAPSWWSGDFSHVHRAGELGGMAYAVQGKNVDGVGLHYGAAIVSQLNLYPAVARRLQS